MNTLITATTLLEYFEIKQPDIKASRLSPAIGAASRRVRVWVGDEVYADALLEEPANPDRAEDLKMAEAWLAMYFGLPGLNTKITPAGVVKTSQVEGKTVLQYLTPAETKALAQVYFDQAHELARRYMLTDETPEAEFAVLDV